MKYCSHQAVMAQWVDLIQALVWVPDKLLCHYLQLPAIQIS